MRISDWRSDVCSSDLEGVNNGILLLVAPNERKVRIEVGYGLEPIMTDALSSVIINQTILPRFRDGDMAGGIIAGADAIGEQMKLPLEAAEQRSAEHTSELQSLMRISYAVFCLTKKKIINIT